MTARFVAVRDDDTSRRSEVTLFRESEFCGMAWMQSRAEEYMSTHDYDWAESWDTAIADACHRNPKHKWLAMDYRDFRAMFGITLDRCECVTVEVQEASEPGGEG